MVRGIDVSAYQGKPDWAKVKQSGIEFAILRIANSKGLDTSFEHNYAGCKANNIAKGVYRYSYAKTREEAAKEAREVVKILDGRKLEMSVWLDLEWSGMRTLGKNAITAIAKSFIQVIRDAGYSCGIYCNLDWHENVLDTEALNVPFWVARYASEDNGTMKENLRPGVGESGWQYSSKGCVSGISGNVDLDVWYESLPQGNDGEKEDRELDQEAVRSLQEALNADGITDADGKALVIDGIKGQDTTAAIKKVLLLSGAFDTRTARFTVGSTGQTVKWLQMRLNTVIGLQIVELLKTEYGLEADGKFGNDTRLAVGLFQEIRGLKQDYKVGVNTITELLYVV